MPGNRLGQSMTEWSTLLSQNGATEVAQQIDEPKLESLHRLQNSGLPYPDFQVIGVSEFLVDPEPYFQELDQQRYFAILSPRGADLRRYRRGRLKEQGVIEFVETTLPTTLHDTYNLILQGAFRNYFGGNIMCGKDGSVEAEMVCGQLGHNQLVSSRAVPEFTAWRNSLSGRFHYSFEDTALRTTLWRTILAIPHTEDPDDIHAPEYRSRDLRFVPGYYEFYLTRLEPDINRAQLAVSGMLRRLHSTPRRPLQPMFIDCSEQPAFQVARPSTISDMERVYERQFASSRHVPVQHQHMRQ